MSACAVHIYQTVLTFRTLSLLSTSRSYTSVIPRQAILGVQQCLSEATIYSHSLALALLSDFTHVHATDSAALHLVKVPNLGTYGIHLSIYFIRMDSIELSSRGETQRQTQTQTQTQPENSQSQEQAQEQRQPTPPKQQHGRH
ncbi:hypothetical protein T310_0749 [Rasamsonia emersonii CBS 393.64]|uniref:Uncharacterized protein n=1 Tax=Rasamsonia emersonii (strain ATCC 16479 / CBS 393.64 / IMI 116815) TaxID=1408163 RepID=A0A0F4Z5T2_RASE3|nr:hypothetical protein T310_0749 [Rasamsonia emersonii CBS 393.64]KKA25223.1 hypothetical protein T310_0749 [Rasamsonia emersonii CBS 393.64]